jgi:hypothetical protein
MFIQLLCFVYVSLYLYIPTYLSSIGPAFLILLIVGVTGT